ncbi:M14 family zinc carboxypeptidase [Sphingomonas sp. BIUV-7]|uniref:M14 family zinc carboxypeptidase n=1 Tax=Sphingomonas natans TaxID=3063330 RepID=A0ABT8YFU6_9SPHN|nr:M14 family zinc carboxypeptidase [Sphingomonas sp. BIUV-7]MDO6416788.1 M14 family zinc carboxypeptidase [Sphingomonas sp. BIUV-7]
MNVRMSVQAAALAATILSTLPGLAQAPLPATLAPPGASVPSGTAALTQPQDAEYGRLIKQHLVDKRFTTELVDHMPASDTVPSPLKFFGRIPGTPGELTYAADIHRYYKELARTSKRVKFMSLGTTEEGREQVVIAIADETTLAKLDDYKAQLAALGDPRRTDAAKAAEIIKTAKPIYWVTSGIHSPETGGPEMLIELAYRLAVEETPFIQNIRNNMITLITPVVEVDGREKMVDTYYYGKKTGKPKPPLVYWGKYVAHDNNRDGMGQFLKLTQNITKGMLEWHPTVLHDLHEAQSYLYTSTGTGPYNDKLDPIQTNEWWLLAETEVMEMTKRGVPGVFTYGFYDGWVPNYLFWIANTHNSFGRFYEVQSYGPDIQKDLKLAPTVTSREWYRPNPPLPSIDWGPRNNTNIQESALLFAMGKVATDRETYLENYWAKSRNAIEVGRTGPINAYVIPAHQHAPDNVVDMINMLRQQGAEVSTATQGFTAGGVQVAAGDYVIRADQPYRTMLDMYFSVQNYPAANPRPYDDTGWTMQLMQNVTLKTIKDPAVFQQALTPLTADARKPGGISGSGSTIVFNHNGDNALVGLRFRLKGTRILAAEAAFDADGRHYAAGSFILPNADRATVARVAATLGVNGEAVSAAPQVATHALSVPRIGYIHSWLRTQDEGWWRAALDTYGIPYDYFADIKLKTAGKLRGKYDVLIYPTVANSGREQFVGVEKNGKDPIPYKKTAMTPNLGAIDSADDIRGGVGGAGLEALRTFVQEGGTLIADGSTVEMLSGYGYTQGVNVVQPSELYSKGSIMRGMITDQTSPIVYGYEGKQLPIYFSQSPVLNVSRGGNTMGYFDPNGPGVKLAQNYTPNAVPVPLSPWDPAAPVAKGGPAGTTDPSPFGSAPPASRSSGAEPTQFPRVVMNFPAKSSDILLSGMLSGGDVLASKPLILDVPDGRGHMVLFTLRPFWRWQTQGSYMLGFNTILNWDHLDAGKAASK